MRSGNDRFPHGGISIVASSVTRFDIPKINSPLDSAQRSRRGRGRNKKEVTGLAFSRDSRSLVALSCAEIARFRYVVRRDARVKSRDGGDARPARCEFCTRDRASPSIKFGDAQGNGVESVSSAIESRNPFVISRRQGPESRDRSLPRGTRFFFYLGEVATLARRILRFSTETGFNRRFFSPRIR